MEKYKHGPAEGWYIYFDENGLKYPDFTKDNRPGMYKAMLEWEAAGNAIEPRETAEEMTEREVKEAEYDLVKYRDLRRAEYLKEGLTFDRWNELTIEADWAGLEEYRQKRDAIRAKYPKTV